MSSNYLVQRKINAHKKFRRKVTLMITLSAVILVLMIVGLVKVIADEQKEAKQDTKTEQEAKPPKTGDAGEEIPATEPTPTPTSTPTPTPTPTPDPAKKIAIDPGHGGEDLGSTRAGLYEKDANLAIAFYLKEILEEAGYKVFMVRETDVKMELAERPALANANGADLYVSIHLNSIEGDSDATRGVEVWYNDTHEDNSKEFAQYVVDAVADAAGARNRGVKKNNELAVLKYIAVPSCLVECGFITSKTERALLFDAEYQQKLAIGIANGIMKFLPLEPQE